MLDIGGLFGAGGAAEGAELAGHGQLLIAGVQGYDGQQLHAGAGWCGGRRRIDSGWEEGE